MVCAFKRFRYTYHISFCIPFSHINFMKIPCAPIKRLLLIFSNSDCLMGKSFEFFTCRSLLAQSTANACQPDLYTYKQTYTNCPYCHTIPPNRLLLQQSVHNSARATIFVENNLQQKDKQQNKKKKYCSQCAYATHVATTAATTAALQAGRQTECCNRQSDNQTIMHIIMPSICGNYQ